MPRLNSHAHCTVFFPWLCPNECMGVFKCIYFVHAMVCFAFSNAVANCMSELTCPLQNVRPLLCPNECVGVLKYLCLVRVVVCLAYFKPLWWHFWIRMFIACVSAPCSVRTNVCACSNVCVLVVPCLAALLQCGYRDGKSELTCQLQNFPVALSEQMCGCVCVCLSVCLCACVCVCVRVQMPVLGSCHDLLCILQCGCRWHVWIHMSIANISALLRPNECVCVRVQMFVLCSCHGLPCLFQCGCR